MALRLEVAALRWEIQASRIHEGVVQEARQVEVKAMEQVRY